MSKPVSKKAKTPKRVKLDEFHWHEVVDRTWLVMETLAVGLEDHPVIKADPELEAELGKAHRALWDLYQLAALKHMAK